MIFYICFELDLIVLVVSSPHTNDHKLGISVLRWTVSFYRFVHTYPSFTKVAFAYFDRGSYTLLL